VLTYEDCLGLSGLSPEEVAVIARHEHLPDIVALEMGWCLCGTADGERRFRHMILDDIEAACRHGDTRRAAWLGLVLHHFLGAHPASQGAGGPSPRAGGAEEAACDRPSGGLRFDAVAAAWMREHADVYMPAMLGHFGLDAGQAEARFPTQMQVAAMCCAACAETRRCRRFLAGLAGAEAPAAFCPNAPLFAELAGLPRADAAARA
jgi:hypothetical protein